MSKRSTDTLPVEIQNLIGLCKSEMRATEVWLFGSRARGDHRTDSDYDILAVVPDDAPEDIDSPTVTYTLRRRARANADLMTARHTDFAQARSVPNTISYTVDREGIRLDA